LKRPCSPLPAGDQFRLGRCSLDIRIARLRRKLEADPDKPQIIRIVRGVGYMLVIQALLARCAEPGKGP
jgi:DNA-binding winged helix-turn-helix (wHTH) protein